MSSIRHRFVSPVTDDPDPDSVSPSHWNDTHVIDSGIVISGVLSGQQAFFTSGVAADIISGRLLTGSGLRVNVISGLQALQMSGATSGFVLTSDLSGLASWRVVPAATAATDQLNLTSGLTAPTISGTRFYGSGVTANLLSGMLLVLQSGLTAVVISGTQFYGSGVVANLISGVLAILNSCIDLGSSVTIRAFTATIGQGVGFGGPGASDKFVVRTSGDTVNVFHINTDIAPAEISINSGAQFIGWSDNFTTRAFLLNAATGDIRASGGVLTVLRGELSGIVVRGLISGVAIRLVSGISASQISGLEGFHMSGSTSGRVLTADNSGIGTWQSVPATTTATDQLNLTSGLATITVSARLATFSGLTTPNISGLLGFQMSGSTSGFVLTSDLSGLASWRVVPAATAATDQLTLTSGLATITVSARLIDGSGLLVHGNTSGFQAHYTSGLAAFTISGNTADLSGAVIDVLSGLTARFSGISAAQISGLLGFQMSGATSGRILTSDNSGLGTWQQAPSIHKTVVLLGPASGLNVTSWRAEGTYTLTAVRGHYVGSSGVTVNARRLDSSGISTGNHLASNLSLTVQRIWSGAAVANTAYVSGDSLEVMLTSTSGNPDQVAIQCEFVRP